MVHRIFRCAWCYSGSFGHSGGVFGWLPSLIFVFVETAGFFLDACYIEKELGVFLGGFSESYYVGTLDNSLKR